MSAVTPPSARRRRILPVVAAVLVLAVLVPVLVGLALPVHHRASRAVHLDAPPAAVFATITDTDRYVEWRSEVERVEQVAGGARPRFREVSGGDAILFEVVERVPDRRFVTRIADPALPFGGTWTYELGAEGTGTRLRITEDGEVRNPLFRFVSRYVLTHTATIDRYLADLQRRLAPR